MELTLQLSDEYSPTAQIFNIGSINEKGIRNSHIWIVDFGKILKKTLTAEYVQSAFGKLEVGSGGNANLIRFELQNFEIKDYRAYTTMNIKALNSGAKVFGKSYHSEGSSQGGQMWTAGPFGMKNATLNSTKQSIDKILEQFIRDINTNNIALN